MIKLFIPVIIWCLSGVILASSSSPLRHIVSEFGSDVFFVMGESPDGKHATGRCYKFSDDGQISLLWTTKGFYAMPSSLRLTSDGMTLVRLHDIPVTVKAGNPVFISVYSKGKHAYSLTLDKFLSWNDLKPNPFTLDVFVTLDAEVESAFEIVGRDEFKEPTEAEKMMTNRASSYLKISTANGRTSLVDLSNGKVVHKFGK